MPDWVTEASNEFRKRLQEFASCNLIEIPLIKRSKSTDLSRILDKEATQILEAIPSSSHVIALDPGGESFSSEKLATKIEALQHRCSHLCFIIGGPEGLAQEVLKRSNERWSLSELTFPHPIVRIVLLETLYRAWTIIHNHPYHK